MFYEIGSQIELNCVSGWKLAPLRIKMMNWLVHGDQFIGSWRMHY